MKWEWHDYLKEKPKDEKKQYLVQGEAGCKMLCYYSSNLNSEEFGGSFLFNHQKEGFYYFDSKFGYCVADMIEAWAELPPDFEREEK